LAGELVPLGIRDGFREGLAVEDPGDLGVAVARRSHGLHDVAVVGRVVVAEKRHELAAAGEAREERGLVLGGGRFEAVARARAHGLVGREETALGVEGERVRVLLRVGDVGRRPRGHETGAGRQLHRLA